MQVLEENIQKYYIHPLKRKFSLNLILLFWIVALGYLIMQGLVKYFVILYIWDNNNITNYLYQFSIYNFPIFIFLSFIHNILTYILLNAPEKIMNRIKVTGIERAEDKEELLSYLYKRQRVLAFVFLNFSLLFSAATMADWVHSPFMVSPSYWFSRFITFFLFFSLGFAAYRLYLLSVVRLTGNVVNKYKISLMGDHKPLNMTYHPLIAAVSMIIYCIFIALYINTLTKFKESLQIQRLVSTSSILSAKNIPADNFLLANIIRRETSQQAIMLVGIDPYIGIGEDKILAIMHGKVSNNFSLYLMIFFVIFIFIIYLLRSIYLITRMINYLSGYTREVLYGVTSLNETVPLLRFDILGYMTGYLNLLFQHIYKIIMNLVKSVIELVDASEKSTASAASGTNEVYNITYSFASINLKADLQLQSIRAMRESFNDLQDIIKSIDEEVSMQKKQLESAKNAVHSVKAAIVEMEQSSQNVAKMFEQLNQSADNGLNIVKNAYTVMAEISQTSYNIRNIVSSIEKISGQTGLLAMSASIESAHAGNHGLGFSVVAQSVRNLSDDSGAQSKAIRLQIEEMVQKVGIGVVLSRHVSRAFQSIANSTETSANLFHQIYDSIEEQNKQSGTISSEIDELLATTEEILNFTREQVEVLDRLTQTTISLENEIKIISDSSQHQLSMSEEVISLFESLNNQVLLNINRVQSINEKINRFKMD